MESYAKDTGPWKKPEKEDGGLQRQEPFLSFKNKKFHFSFWYIIASLLAFFLINFFLSQSFAPQDKLVEFSDFKQRIETGEIKRIEMSPDFYRGLTRTGKELREADARQAAAAYKTLRVDDPSFIALMDTKGVEYYAVPKQDSSFLDQLLRTVLPIVIMVVIWRFMSQRMGNVGSNVLSFGQNKSKIVAEGDVEVRFGDVAGSTRQKKSSWKWWSF